MAKRKRTKGEAIERLNRLQDDLEEGVGEGKAKLIFNAGFAGARALTYLDPFNRLADEVIVVPVPMIAIPAHEAYRLSSNPTMQIYIRAGETIMPTGGNVADVAEGEAQAEVIAEEVALPKKRRATKYQRAYKRAFKKIAPKYKLKNGKWKKGGFKQAVKQAHKIAGGKK